MYPDLFSETAADMCN